MPRRRKNVASGIGVIMPVSGRGNAIFQLCMNGLMSGNFKWVEKHAGGRPTYKQLAVQLFDERRDRREPLARSKLNECRWIHKELAKRLRWPSDPKQHPVQPETIASYPEIRRRWREALADQKKVLGN